jgi:hypothetical protein
VNANELNPPPRFFYYYFLGTDDDWDYLSPLMSSWFREDDIVTFQPADRYITGKALTDRWSARPDIKPEAFIKAKIAESRLLDAHPIYGTTRGTRPDPTFPPLESALFALAHVQAIEVEDFSRDNEGTAETKPLPAEAAIGSPDWRSETARAAANARHNRPGASRDKQEQMRSIWATGKYSSRDLCAEEECGALNMSFSAARKALRNTPDP